MTDHDSTGDSSESERRTELSAQELDELLGAYALDAVSDDERRAIEEYLLVNPRARAEVAEHREVAGMLAWSGTTAPEGLWDRIAASLDETAPAPSGELAAVLAFDTQRQARGPAPTAGRSGRSRWVTALSWSALGAAAALVAVLVLTTATDDDSPEVAAPIELALAEAREDEGAKTAMLVSTDGQTGGEVVIDSEGNGFLVADRLPALTADRTWQLWGVVDGEAISLGIVGPEPEIEAFTVAGDVTDVMVTNEVAGGVITNGNTDGAYAADLTG